MKETWSGPYKADSQVMEVVSMALLVEMQGSWCLNTLLLLLLLLFNKTQ